MVALGDGIVNSKLPTLGIFDTVRCELILPRLFPVFVVVAIVLGIDHDASFGGGEVRDNVSPPLVVVHTQGDNEELVGVGQEAKGTGSTTATHGENVFVVDFRPGAAIGIVPAGLLDDPEAGIGVGLVDAGGNCVTHSVELPGVSPHSVMKARQRTW